MPGILATIGISTVAYWGMVSSYSQLFGKFPYRGPRGDRVVALTFDDGPNEPYTSQIADFLHGQGIRATFFQVGVCVERFPGVSRHLNHQGHLIGNHSYSHRLTRCLLPGVRRRETSRAQQVLHTAIGRTPALYRPPWLLRTPALMRALEHIGLQPISGEFGHAFEVFQPSPARIANRALAKVHPGAILIFHDGFNGRGGDRSNTVAAVKIVVETLQRRGYGFVTVAEMLRLPAYLENPRLV